MMKTLTFTSNIHTREGGGEPPGGGNGRRRNDKGADLTTISARALALERTRRYHPKFADIVDRMLLEAGILRRAASGGDGGGRHLDLSTVPRIASGMAAKCDDVTTTMEAMTTTRIPTTAAMRIPTMATLPRAAARGGYREKIRNE